MNEAEEFKIQSLTPEYWAKFDAEQRACFPGAIYGSVSEMVQPVASGFENALRAGSEEAIQKFLTANPYILQYALQNTGHHGVWVFPKRMIGTQKADGTPGLIPDFLLCARNSFGYTWYIFELKRADKQFANMSGSSISPGGQKALVQCATYLSHFNDYIENVRDNIGVTEVIQPKNVILLMGDSRTETEAQTKIRKEHHAIAKRIEVISYDRLRSGLANDLRPRGE